VPLQEVLQQKPSAQLAEAHWSPLSHARPLGSFPHELPMHCTPAAQSASEVQVVRQSPLAHPKGQHTRAGPGLQEPLPSQMLPPDTVCWSQTPALQLAPET